MDAPVRHGVQAFDVPWLVLDVVWHELTPTTVWNDPVMSTFTGLQVPFLSCCSNSFALPNQGTRQALPEAEGAKGYKLDFVD